MGLKGWKRMVCGEAMPSKDAPQHRDKYERDVEAGRKFARFTRLDRAAARVQRFATEHRAAFLAIVLTFISICFVWNAVRLVVLLNGDKYDGAAVEVTTSGHVGAGLSPVPQQAK